MAPSTSKRALVTGAAGFIGSHVVDGCLELGMDVVATDDLSGGFRENVSEEARWVEGDLRDSDFVRSLWDDGRYDYVYHLGAYAAEGLSHFSSTMAPTPGLRGIGSPWAQIFAGRNSTVFKKETFARWRPSARRRTSLRIC